jgi:adenylate cyclase class 2
VTKLYEVEVKRKLETDKDSLIASMIEIGYTQGEIVVESDDYYSRTDVDYMETVECLRIRNTPKKREITYKPPTTDFSATTIIKEEKNLPLVKEEDVEIAKELLLAIGMVHLVKVEKHRQSFTKSYKNHDVTVTIDSLPGVGDYIEVEILSSDPEDAEIAVSEVETELSLKSMPLVTLPYRDIVMQSENV